MKRLRLTGYFVLAGLAYAPGAHAGALIKSYDSTTGTDETFSATAPWQMKWNSGNKSSGMTVRIEDAATGAYVSEVDGVSGNVRVDASGTFRVTTRGGQGPYRITISKLP